MFEWSIVEASLLVQQADPISPPELCLVPPCVIELELVLGNPFVDQDSILADLLGLATLDFWD